MRFFNTSGPCDPEKHYTVMREALIAKGETLVAEGHYFTLFAPRQAGKTTYFQLLLDHLRTQAYTAIWVSFEGFKTLTRLKFYKALHHRLAQEFATYGIEVDITIEDQFDLQLYLERISICSQLIVLVIDEFEEIPDDVLNEVMHVLRAMYQKRQHHKLQSLILAGVSTMAELILTSASPFNVADELALPYFTLPEVRELIGQHTAETGQAFTDEVIQAIYDNTQGQPGLVNALCHYLVTEMAPDRRQAVTMVAFYPTLKHFLTARFDKNISNIVQKAREERDLMLRILFDDTPIPFTVNDPRLAYLYAHGVIANVDGNVDIALPLYSKALIAAFRPLVNGEASHFTAAHDDVQDYVSAAGLNVRALLEKYRDYVRRRGFRAFDTDHLKEGAWHYSLDGFINFFIERLGGDTLVEVPTGRGRTDIVILYQQHKYIIETKRFVDQSYFESGKYQLATYLTSEGVDEGYYVVFSNKHSPDATLFFDERIAGKHICTYIILTDFEQASRRGQSDQAKI